MRIDRLAAAALLGISALGLSACATGLRTEVSRYQAMPGPQGQSFFIVPADPANPGGLEFARFAGQVAQAMQAQGYSQAANPAAATMLVRLDYGVDEGEERIESDPFARGYGYDPFWSGSYSPWRGYFGRPYYSRFGYWGPRSAFYYGWNDPYWYAPYGGGYGYGGIRSYTEYHSFLDLDIRRKVDNAQIFDGHAQARSTNDNLGVLVPNLIEAMFTGFPGQSGETIKITVPPHKKS
jgi:hypothetical protein